MKMKSVAMLAAAEAEEIGNVVHLKALRKHEDDVATAGSSAGPKPRILADSGKAAAAMLAEVVAVGSFGCP